MVYYYSRDDGARVPVTLISLASNRAFLGQVVLQLEVVDVWIRLQTQLGHVQV